MFFCWFFFAIILLFYLLKEYGYYRYKTKVAFLLHFGSLGATLLLFKHYEVYCKRMVVWGLFLYFLSFFQNNVVFGGAFFELIFFFSKEHFVKHTTSSSPIANVPDNSDDPVVHTTTDVLVAVFDDPAALCHYARSQSSVPSSAPPLAKSNDYSSSRVRSIAPCSVIDHCYRVNLP